MNTPAKRYKPVRRIEALAYILERITRSGTSPSYGEIGAALRPSVTGGRARQYVDQLVAEGFIERPSASRRGIRLRDVVRCRRTVEEALGQAGWYHASPMGVLEDPYTIEQLPLIRLIRKDREVN